MAAGLLVSGRSSCERGAGLVVCERQLHLPWAAPSPGEKGSLRGFTEKVIPVEDKEQLQGEHGVGDEQARWGAGCKKAQEILSSMLCHCESFRKAGAWGSSGKWGEQKPSLIMCQLRCLGAILHYHVFYFLERSPW